MDLNIKSRLTWVNLFLETNNAGYVYRRCGISRPTLRKWVNRYNKLGIDGLTDKSKRLLRAKNYVWRFVSSMMKVHVIMKRNSYLLPLQV